MSRLSIPLWLSALSLSSSHFVVGSVVLSLHKCTILNVTCVCVCVSVRERAPTSASALVTAGYIRTAVHSGHKSCYLLNSQCNLLKCSHVSTYNTYLAINNLPIRYL